MKAESVFRTTKLWLLILILFLSALLTLQAKPSGDLSQLPAKLELEIHRMMLNGNIPSAAVALVHGDEIVWSGAFGYANVWAKTPAFPNTVYLIGSTFKALDILAAEIKPEEARQGK